jgi:two-component system chemotaxis response regulator CheY
MIKSILVVDDSGTARMFVRRCLEAIGFSEANFHEAGDGQAALAILKKNPIDLVMTDLTMPIMGGEELLSSIKSNSKIKNSHVLVVTSAGNKARESILLDKGALAVISKPFAPAALYTILQPHME